MDPNTRKFPDLPSSDRARRTPAIFQNEGHLACHHVDKAVTPSLSSSPTLCKIFPVPSANQDNVIFKSHDHCFDDFLG